MTNEQYAGFTGTDFSYFPQIGNNNNNNNLICIAPVCAKKTSVAVVR